MSTTPCGLGHNGGPPLDDLEPLVGLYSLTIAEASKRTGLSRSRIYRFFDAGRLRAFKVGKQRLIIAQSLRQLLAELAANPESAPPSSPRQGGRFMRSPEHAADENAAGSRRSTAILGNQSKKEISPRCEGESAGPPCSVAKPALSQLPTPRSARPRNILG